MITLLGDVECDYCSFLHKNDVKHWYLEVIILTLQIQLTFLCMHKEYEENTCKIAAGKEMRKMVTDVELPQWLDQFIFEELGGKYCRSCSDMTVIDWEKNDVLNYLGTYFPRSYAESYCIFGKFFNCYPDRWSDEDSLSIFDFGCGTGGEIIGLLMAVAKNVPNIKNIEVKALDGNTHALRLLEKVVTFSSSNIGINTCIHVIPCKIDDFYDLSILNLVVVNRYDIIMSVKAICEFVTKDCFEKKNAYKHIVEFMLPKLKDNGILFLEDVTTYNNVSQEWLPQMMENGLTNLDEHIILKNYGFNQSFVVSHSKRKKDVSKVAWRIIQKPNQI